MKAKLALRPIGVLVGNQLYALSIAAFAGDVGG